MKKLDPYEEASLRELAIRCACDVKTALIVRWPDLMGEKCFDKCLQLFLVNRMIKESMELIRFLYGICDMDEPDFFKVFQEDDRKLSFFIQYFSNYFSDVNGKNHDFKRENTLFERMPEKIVALMTENGLSRLELQGITNISMGGYYHIMKKPSTIKASNLCKIAKALNVSAEYLVNDSLK